MGLNRPAATAGHARSRANMWISQSGVDQARRPRGPKQKSGFQRGDARIRIPLRHSHRSTSSSSRCEAWVPNSGRGGRLIQESIRSHHRAPEADTPRSNRRQKGAREHHGREEHRGAENAAPAQNIAHPRKASESVENVAGSPA